MEKVVVSGVAYDKNQAKVTLSGLADKPGIAAKLFGMVSGANVNVDMIIQNASREGVTDLSFTVPRTDLKKALPKVKQAAKAIGCKDVSVDENIAKVSIIGVGMRSHSGVAARMFKALADEGVNIMMISTSEIKVSCVIEAKYTELAVRALHEAFGLDKAA
jgi:aspartate kinase